MAPSPSRVCDPVGIVEIVDRLGISRATVDQWKLRYSAEKVAGTSLVPFPEPRWTVGGRPAWNWDEIVAWAKATGRTVPDQAPAPA